MLTDLTKLCLRDLTACQFDCLSGANVVYQIAYVDEATEENNFDGISTGLVYVALVAGHLRLEF